MGRNRNTVVKKPLVAVNNKTMKKLFLDDLRTIDMVYDPSMENDFDIVRTYEAFVDYIKLNGLPEFISFDNDLGLDENWRSDTGRICRSQMAGL